MVCTLGKMLLKCYDVFALTIIDSQRLADMQLNAFTIKYLKKFK